MNASILRIAYHWANAQSFPPIGACPPTPGEKITTIGGGRQERAIVKRDAFEAQVAGFFQTVDTVSLEWIVLPTVVRRVANRTVKLHVPMSWFGTISHEEYRSALVGLTECLLDPTVGEIRRQPFIYNYFSTLLCKTVSFAETLPTCCYDSAYVDCLWQSVRSEGTVIVPSQAYPLRSSRWGFEVTDYNSDPTILRADIQAPKPYQFSCVTIIPLGSLPPRHRSCNLARRRQVIEQIKSYIRALEENDVFGQYAH